MRFIRLIFVAFLALVLVAVALANRQVVTLSLFPANLGEFLGGTWSVAVPLFLVIFVAFALGMLAGLIWEWMREAKIRKTARQRSRKVEQLENEVGQLRENHAAPRDDVLAILEQPSVKSRPATGHAQLPAAR